jgi:glutamine synthetase
MTSPSGSTPDEAKAFLDAHPEIEAFDIVLTDANGVGRGKIIRRHELMGLYEHGRHCRSRSSASTSPARMSTRPA